MMKQLTLLIILLFSQISTPSEINIERAAANTDALEKGKLRLRSEGVLLADKDGNILYSRNADTPRPIASVTKLMAALVILEAKLKLNEVISITKNDRDLVKLTGSHLKVGAKLTRKELIYLAVLSSENRAALALSRTYPGGKRAFITEMNRKSKTLGMMRTNFIDPAGLSPLNTSTPNDLLLLLEEANKYALLKEIAGTRSFVVKPYQRLGKMRYVNTNRFSRNKHWELILSKTGYINEAGRCLVMKARVDDMEVTMILLDSYGKLTPFGDANRAREWLKRYRKSA